MAEITVGDDFGFNKDLTKLFDIKLSSITGASIDPKDADTFRISLKGGDAVAFTGHFTKFGKLPFLPAFTFPTQGSVKGIIAVKGGADAVSIQDISVSIGDVITLLANPSPGAGLAAINTLLGGNDSFKGGKLTDEFNGFGKNDTIIGNGGADKLRGGDGEDKLYAGLKAAGASDGAVDTLYGGKGNDTFYTDSRTDKIVELKGEGTDKVLARGDFELTKGAEIESIYADAASGHAAVTLVGNEFAQLISGNAGDNIINGKQGSDYLRGETSGAASAGRDIFVFDTKLNDSAVLANGQADLNKRNVDRMNEFQSGEDKIALDNLVFKKLGAAGALTHDESKQFVLNADFFKDLRDVRAGDAALDGNDYIQYDVKGGVGTLYYDADGGGTGKGVAFAQLTNHPDLSHSDFIVI